MAGIVVSSAYALGAALSRDPDLPILGWQSFATIYTISASSERTAFPATNMANPSTANRWESDSLAEQFITVMFGVEREVDYVGVARHNWATAGALVSIEGLPFGGNPLAPADWVEIFEPLYLADDGPRVFRFEPTFLIGLRVRLLPGTVKPRAAVLKVGMLTIIKRVAPGHRPMKYSRSVEKISGRAQGGDYLGTIVAGAKLSSSIEQQSLEPNWYRAVLEPFRLACEDECPFFWAWAPETYPAEVAYCWVVNDPIPTEGEGLGYIDISFAIEGIAI